MNKQISALYGSFAAGLETAAAAARQLEAMQDEESPAAPAAVLNGSTNGATNGAANGKAAEKVAPPVKPAKAAKTKAATPAITFEVLKAKLTELVNTKGKEAAKEILSTFGAPKLVDLDEENYADAHAAAVAAMAEADEPASTDDDDMFGE